MNNVVILLGRIKAKFDDYLVLEVMDTNTLSSGNYKIHVFNVYLPEKIAENVAFYTHVGDSISVKGMLVSEEYTDGKQCYRRLRVVAQKVTFLSSKDINVSAEDDEDEES